MRRITVSGSTLWWIGAVGRSSVRWAWSLSLRQREPYERCRPVTCSRLTLSLMRITSSRWLSAMGS